MHAHPGWDLGPQLLTWSADPAALVLIPLAALLYARGLASLGSPRRFHDGWRPQLFYLGLALALAVLVGPLDHLAGELFLAHMTQHVVLVLVAVGLGVLALVLAATGDYALGWTSVGGLIMIAAYFGGSARVWLRLQADYDLAVAERKHGEEIKRTVRAA